MVGKRTGGDLLAADVHKTLRTKILSLEIKPRTRLVEDEISASLNVGRTPVREALLRLQGEGLVSRSRGWVVEEGDPADVQSIFESRMAIEGFGTRLAAGRVQPEGLAHLRSLVEQMENLDGISRVQLNQLNREFHETIVRQSQNAFFFEMHERTQFNYWNLRLPVLFTRDQVEGANRQHRDILAALEAHDEDEAEKQARLHITTTYDIVRDALAGF